MQLELERWQLPAWSRPAPRPGGRASFQLAGCSVPCAPAPASANCSNSGYKVAWIKK